MLRKIHGGGKYARILTFILALLMAFSPCLKPSVVSAEEVIIYKQVDEFTDGKEYILAAKDKTDETVYQAVYNKTVGTPVELAGTLDIEVIEGGSAYHPAFSGIRMITKAVDSRAVWTAAASGNGFTFKNGSYYLYPGGITASTGKGGGGTVGLWGAVADRICVLEGKTIYGDGNSDYYLTYTAADGFGVSTTKGNAAEIYIFEKVVITGGGIEITGYDAIADIAAGTAGSAIYANAEAVKEVLPDEVTITGTISTVPIISWEDTGGYDPDTAGIYVFNGELGTLPGGYIDAIDTIAFVTVKVIVVPSGEMTIYKQVNEFTEGKEYILAAKDKSIYQAVHNKTVGTPVEAPGALDIEVTEDGAVYSPILSGIRTVTGDVDARAVWTAAASGNGFTLKNGDYYLYGGRISPSSGESSGSGTVGLWGAVASRPWVLEGRAIYCDGNSDYYLTYAAAGGFGVSSTKGNAAEIYIFEKMVIIGGSIEITGYDPIDDIDAGMAGKAKYADAEAVIAALPDEVTITGTTLTVPISSWKDTDGYNPEKAGIYVFTGTLGTLPAGYADAIDPITCVTVNVVISAKDNKIYKQVDEFTDGKEYILAVKDGSGYYAVTNETTGLPVKAAGSYGIQVTEDGAAFGEEFNGISIIDGTPDPMAVWTAAASGDGFTFKNGDYYLYAGGIDASTGEGGGGTAGLWAVGISRALILEDTTLYGKGSSSTYYLTYSSGSGFGVSTTKENAAEILIFENAGEYFSTKNIFMGSDVHAKTSDLSDILRAVSGDATPELVALVGDYNTGMPSSAIGSEKLDAAISGIFNPEPTKRYLIGNHEESSLIEDENFIETGEIYRNNSFIVYGINEDDFPSTLMGGGVSESYNRAKATTDALRIYLENLSPTDKEKVIFILCHVPLHAIRNDNPGGYYMANMLNEVINNDLEIVFIWGHNHTTSSENILLTKGTTYAFYDDSDGDNINDGVSRSLTLEFTYANAGYITNGYGMLASVDNDFITLQRYTSSGKYGSAVIIYRNDLVITGMEIVKPPDRTVYYEGQSFDPTGMQVRVDYSGGSFLTNSFTYSPMGPLKTSDKEITVSYGGFTAKLAITVEESTAELNRAFFGTDMHTKTSNLSGILKEVAKDASPVLVALTGDFNNYGAATEIYPADIDAVVTGIFPVDPVKRYLLGNHEPTSFIGTGNFWPTGEVYKNDSFIVYGINEDDFPTTDMDNDDSTDYSTAKATADELEGYLRGLSSADKEKVIFILCHVPLHDARDDNPGGYYMANMLNEVIDNDLDIVFVWGHNHTYSTANILVKKGETYAFYDDPDGDNSNDGNSYNLTVEFTYINAGYITEGYGLLASVDEDTITLQRYTASGESGAAYVIERNSIPTGNTAPVLGAIGNRTVNELSLLSFTATATDEDTLTYSLDGAPVGAVINAGTGAFSWTPTEAQGPGEYTFTVKVSDGELEDTEEITITVNEVNSAPMLEAIGSKSVGKSSLLSFTATATDPDFPPNTLSFSLEGAPEGAAINAGAGAFSWTPTEAGTYTFTVKVSDGELYDTEVITVTVVEGNSAPILGAIGNKSVDELQELIFSATATDAYIPAGTLTFSLDEAPEGAVIDAGTGAFSWTPTEAQGPGEYTFIVKVSDGELEASEEITVTVNEVNSAPVLGAIGSKSVRELSRLSFTAKATDVDIPANTLTFSLEGAPVGATINAGTGFFSWTPVEAGTYTFTVKVSDGKLEDWEAITVTVVKKSSGSGSTGSSGSKGSSGSSKSKGSSTVTETPKIEEIPEEKVPAGVSKIHTAYINGYPDGTVRAEGYVTREEAAAVFFRLLDAAYSDTTNAASGSFGDVDRNRWSAKYIESLVRKDIINGYADGNYYPERYITRAELVVIASRINNLAKVKGDAFTDVAGHWAEGYIYSAYQKGWIKGYADGTFKPDKYVSRAELVTFANKMLNRSVKPEGISNDAKQFSDLNKDKWYYADMQEAVNSHYYELSEDQTEKWINTFVPEN